MPARMSPSATISHFSRAVERRKPHTRIAVAATALMIAKKPFAVPFFEPPMPKSAPWLTRGMTGALKVWSAANPQSQSGVSGSNWAMSSNHPGTTCRENEFGTTSFPSGDGLL